MTTILAIECATGPCSVAVWSAGRIAARLENTFPVMQSAALIGMIEEALSRSGLAYRDLTLVAATIGPGGFTGIRTCLAAARGIAFAAHIPAAGYTTLEVIAFAAGGDCLAAVNAGKGDYVYQTFAGGKPASAPYLAAADPACALVAPRADALAELAALDLVPSQPLRPYYIRPPDAKLPVLPLPHAREGEEYPLQSPPFCYDEPQP